MSFDGILFYKLSKELNELSTGRIDKIQEVSDCEFLLTIRRNRINYKLLISLTANYPRINLTNSSFSFPREPKSFTMLLRKHFEGSIIDSIYSKDTDRIIVIETSRYDELGDFQKTKLIVEIMGRYSNLIIVKNDFVIDALRHIGISEMRSIMPNSRYEYPDTLNKINPFNYTKDELTNILKNIKSPKELTDKILGLSYQNAVLVYDKEDYINNFFEIINSSTPSITNNDINYISNDNSIKFNSFSELLDNFYQDKSNKDRIKLKTNNISNYINKLIKKDQNKIIKLNQELEDTKKAEIYKLYGELLIANSYISDKKDKIEVLNYYTNEIITIPLDNKLYIKENANNYFKKYKKSKNTVIHVNEELQKAKDEIEYLTLLKSQVDNATLLDDVLQIQDELVREKLLILNTKQTKLSKPKILTYLLNDYQILVGKNNMQNEIVTHELALRDELWFHVKDGPGSHVVLKKKDNYTEEDIRTCANIAAYYSIFKDSSSVAVNYTKVKYIKSIPGKKKCFVSISNEKTIYIDPDIELIKTLKISNK